MGFEKSGREGPGISESCVRANLRHCGGLEPAMTKTYPHNEQILYGWSPLASPDVQTAKSSELPALICNAALRGDFSRGCRLGFACECINSLQRTRSALPKIRYQLSGNLYDSHCRRVSAGLRHRQLAYAAGDHRLR